MMRDVRLGSAACEADITHVSLTCGPDSSLNTANKSNKHTDDPNLNDMVLLVETILEQKKTKLLIVEDVVGTCMVYSDVAVPSSVRMTRAEKISLGFFRITYKTAAEQAAKEREKRLAPANKKKAKVHKKKSAPPHKKKSPPPPGARQRVVWCDSPGWTRLKRAASIAGYYVAKIDVCDHKDLGRPANRPRTFAVFSLERPVRDLHDAFTATCRSHRANDTWNWLEEVIMKKRDLVRYVAYVRYATIV